MVRYQTFFVTVCLISPFLFSLPSHAQIKQSISGFVFDAQSNLPVADANVFIAHSTLGAASNDKGAFVIPNVPFGTFDVVVSVIGYEVQKRRIRVAGTVKRELVFRLNPRILEAPEIEISASEQRKWRENFETFKELFLSTTQHAAECEIENPFTLDFSQKGEVFTASAAEPVVILNRALGYKLSIVLEIFQSANQIVRYSGIPRFEELPPEDTTSEQVWQENRLRAYQGSLRHFLAALCKYYDIVRSAPQKRYEFLSQDYLDENGYDGFKAYQVKDPWANKTIYRAKVVDVTQLLRPGELPNERKFSFTDYLDVTFLNELEESQYRMYRNEYRGIQQQRSLIKLNVDTLVVNIDGDFHTPFGIRTYGYWAWEKTAEMLPFDYSPPGAEKHP